MRPVTLVAKIKPGQEEPLRALLTEISGDIGGNSVIRFDEDVSTHFARWFIIKTPDQGPRLVFAATFNGDLASYAEEMVRVSPGLSELWGKCEGYTKPASFPDFVRSHAVPIRYSFCAYPHETVTTIRAKAALRRRLEELCDLDSTAHWMKDTAVRDLLAMLAAPASGPLFLRRLERSSAALGLAIARGLRALVGPIADRGTQLYSEFGEPKQYPRLVDIYSNPGRRRTYLHHCEDLDANVSPYVQNQLTVLAPVVPGRLLRLRLALLLGGWLARYGYPPGELDGTYTIHSLHWVVIDDGRTGLVMSNYDGSWENYLGDFAAKLTYGLNALFNNCADYPPGGLHRVEAWGQWIRTGQLVVPLYYSAYPRESAAQIARDRTISAAMLGVRDRHDPLERVLSLL